VCVYVGKTCSYPNGSGGVRACQTDDEKELVHSRYPCESLKGRGREGGGRSGRGWSNEGEDGERAAGRAGKRGMRERDDEGRAGGQGAGLRLRCVLVWPKGVEGRISGRATPWEDGEGWSSGADGGTPPERVAAVVRDGKGELDNLGAARLPKQ